MVESCIRNFMNKAETINYLYRLNFDPDIIEKGKYHHKLSNKKYISYDLIVWDALEEQNKLFFRVYYVRIRMRNQILCFNQILKDAKNSSNGNTLIFQ